MNSFPIGSFCEKKMRTHISIESFFCFSHFYFTQINYHPKVVGTKKKLKLTVSSDTAGRYFCKANVPGFPEIKSAADVFLKQQPKISSNRQQYGMVGDTTQLECAAISIPRARHISWSFHGREINGADDPEFSILEETTDQEIKSTLIIRKTQARHFDKYNCSVVNDYGTDVLPIELLHTVTVWRYVTAAANLPIFITIAVMTVLILIVIVCFVFIKTMGRKARQVKNEKQFIPHDNYMLNFADVSSILLYCVLLECSAVFISAFRRKITHSLNFIMANFDQLNLAWPPHSSIKLH